METSAQENVLLSQNQPILPEQPKQNNFLVILLSILLLLSVSIAGFFAYKTQTLVKELNILKLNSTTVTVSEPTLDLKADWKSYTNTESGYSVKYPSNWKLIEGEEVDDGYVFLCSNCTGRSENPEFIIYVVERWVKEDLFKIDTDNSIETFFNSKTVSEINIGSQKGFKAIFDETSEYPSPIATKILVPYGGKIYIIYIRQSKVGVEYDKNLDQILSTFKIVPIEQNTGLKSFTNSKYSLSVKYPIRFNRLNELLDDGYYETIGSFSTENEETISIGIIKNVGSYTGISAKEVAIKESAKNEYKHSVTETKIGLYDAAITSFEDSRLGYVIVTLAHPKQNVFITLYLPNDLSKTEFEEILTSISF